jgi:hypothetical protein
MEHQSHLSHGELSTSQIRFAQLSPDEEGGVEIKNVPQGLMLEVRTKNHTYTVIPQKSGECLIWGHPEICPEPTMVQRLGSSIGYIQREGYLGPGMRLIFRTHEHPIQTSRIVGIRAVPRQ